MKRQRNFFPIAIICLIFACTLYFFSASGFIKGIEYGVGAVMSPVSSLFSVNSMENSECAILRKENKVLLSQLVKLKNMQAENKALLDQFQTSYPKSTQLLPARIVAAPSFLPGISFPDTIIIDKGEKDGIKKGQAVVRENHLIGVIQQTGSFGSKVILISSPQFSLRVKTISSKAQDAEKESAMGLLKGKGNGQLSIESVLLSESLSPKDVVVSFGDLSEDGLGVPADLIVGEIHSVDKKPSAVFQSAEIKRIFSIEDFATVFVATGVGRE